MPNKKKGKKAKRASDKSVTASVTKEMARPRKSLSAQVEQAGADEQSTPKYGKPTRFHVGAAKPHVEQYGTGTPTVKK